MVGLLCEICLAARLFGAHAGDGAEGGAGLGEVDRGGGAVIVTDLLLRQNGAFWRVVRARVRVSGDPAYPSCIIWRRPSSRAAISGAVTAPSRLRRRSFATARIWSLTATAV